VRTLEEIEAEMRAKQYQPQSHSPTVPQAVANHIHPGISQQELSNINFMQQHGPSINAPLTAEELEHQMH